MQAQLQAPPRRDAGHAGTWTTAQVRGNRASSAAREASSNRFALVIVQLGKMCRALGPMHMAKYRLFALLLLNVQLVTSAIPSATFAHFRQRSAVLLKPSRHEARRFG